MSSGLLSLSLSLSVSLSILWSLSLRFNDLALPVFLFFLPLSGLVLCSFYRCHTVLSLAVSPYLSALSPVSVQSPDLQLCRHRQRDGALVHVGAFRVFKEVVTMCDKTASVSSNPT